MQPTKGSGKIKQAIFYLLLVLIAVDFSACKKKVTNQAELIAYINDPENGLKKEELIGKIKATLTYKPWQLVAANYKKKDISKFNFKDKLYFVLSLSADNKEILRQLPFSQYSEMVQVLAFRMNEFVSLTPYNAKSIDPLECNFQQTYGMGIANNVLLVFNKSYLLKAENLKINIKEFGLNTGDLKFKIQTKDIREIENIALN